MVEALQIMIGTHPDDATFLETYTTGTDWETGTKREATTYLKVLTDFDFIVGIISLYRLLHPVAPIAQKHQGRTGTPY